MWPSDLGLADVAELLPGAALVVELDSRIVAATSRATKLMGCEIGQPLTACIAEHAEAFGAYLRQCAGCRNSLPGAIILSGDDGENRRIAVTGTRLPGDTVRIFLHCDEATLAVAHNRFRVLNEKIQELSLEIGARRRAEAMLEAQKEVLANVVGGVGLKEALTGFARSLESHGSGMCISVLLLDHEQRLRHAAAPSLSERYCRAIDGTKIGPSVGSCGTAAYKREVVVASDIATDPRWKDFRELALSEGLRASWSAPILGASGAVLGTIAIYYRSVHAPSRTELRMIQNCAHIASLTIDRYQSQQALESLLATEQQLREEAEEQSKAKDHFLAVLSHELRNPLGALANAAMVLEAMGDVDEERASFQKVIIAEIQVLRRILDDLLDLSRLAAGKTKLKLERLDTDEMLRTVAEAFRLAVTDRELTVELPEDLPAIEGDRARLEQVLNNLLENARKYSNAGDRIELRAETSGDQLRIRVRDTGIGIDPKLLPRMFEPFVQLDESLDRAGSGLGLGLALVREFTERHGGTVTASSDGNGQGSEFTVSLPVKSTTPAQESPRQEQSPVETKFRVLVVEDNTAAREGLCKLLQIWGHDATGAVDGEQALEYVHSNPPDIALVDIGLPRMNGYELASAIREHETDGRILLVALTGYGQPQDRARSLEAGFDKHMVKPLDSKELQALLAAHS